MKKLHLSFLCTIALCGCATTQPNARRPGAVLQEGEFPKVAPTVLASSLDKLPKPIRLINPKYPHSLQKNEISGVVKVEFIVTSRGNVSSTTVKESPDPALSKAAEEAILQWEFEPGEKNGQKVNSLMTVPITFAVEKK